MSASTSVPDSPFAPLSPISIAFPSLVRQRQQLIAAQPSYSYGAGDQVVHTGSWVAFSNNAGAEALLSGPNGGGGVGLPNYVPFGHPSLKDSPAREKFGDKSLAAVVGSLGPAIGLEGKPYEAPAERNRREANVVSETTAMLAAMTRDPTFDAPSSTTFANLARLKLAAGPGGPTPVIASKFPARTGMPHFDVEKFLRSNHRQLSNADRLTATEVLKVEPYDRDASHLSTLSKFLASVDFFAGLSDNLRNDIAAIATLRVLRKEEAVYVEGEEAMHLYVVLSGSVGTKVKNFLTTRGPASQAASSFVAATVGAGECFGQESMGTEERTLTRTQTKVALERTELLQVDMRDYKSILRISMSKESADKLDFVALLPLFEMCTMRELHRIASCLQIVKYPKNHVIIKQGEVSDKVYFIESGEARVIHKIYSSTPIHLTPHHRLHSPPRCVDTAQGELNRRSGMSELTGFGLHAPTKSGRGEQKEEDYNSSSQHHQHLKRGGGGSYKFERARAFQASRNGGGSAAAGGGLKSSEGSNRPAWGQSGSNTTAAGGSRQQTAGSNPQKTHQLVPQLLDLGRLGPKWFFGEKGVLTDEPRSASVYAETNITLMVMSREDFFTRLPPFCLKYIEDYMNTFYAPETVMKEQWHAQQRWDKFKSALVRPGKPTTSSSLMEVNKKFSATLNAIKY